MVNINKICAYLREELERNTIQKTELENIKEKLIKDTERQKNRLDEYKQKTKQKLRIIENARKTPGISDATVKKFAEMQAEAEENIDAIDEKINGLYDELDVQTEKIDDQLYAIDEKIDEINEFIEESGDCGYRGENEDEKLIRDLEEEIKKIDMGM